MKFEYPQFFFAFFFLAIPIIIHLFNFRKYKTLHFSSLLFIKQINEETKSTQKLKHLFILISRILAFSALIFAFAQPYFAVNKKSKGGYAFIGIYLDNSFSMSLKGSEGELLSMAKEKARSIIQKASSDTRFMLVTNNFEGFEQRLTTKSEVLERIDKIELSPMIRNLDAVISWIKDGLSEEIIQEKNLSSKQIILLSDFQKKTAIFDKMQTDEEIFYYPIQLLPQNPANISVDSIWFSDPNFKIGINNELNVKLKNYSDYDLVNLELQLEVNQIKRNVFFDLKEKDSTIVKINYSDLKPGLKKGLVRINDRQMHFDDDYFFSYQVKEKSSVLIVDGENSVSNISLVYSLDKYYQTSSIKQNAFTSNALEQKDLLILNGWNEISTAAQETIINFCKDGGTLAFFPGENLDFNSVNVFFNRLNAPRMNGILNSGTKIQHLAYEDPFFQGMFEKKPDRLNLPTQTKAYHISKRNAVNLIKMQNGFPLFLKVSGTNPIYIFASSLTESFGNFTSNALFSSILLRIAETSQRRYPISLIIGSETKFPIYDVPQMEQPLKLKSESFEFIPQIEKINHLTTISINKQSVNADLKSGFFEIIKGKTIGYIALNYNRSESDVTPLSKKEIETLFASKGIKYVSFSTLSNQTEASLIKIEKPKEYWRIFLILAIIFLLIEMSLLRWMK